MKRGFGNGGGAGILGYLFRRLVASALLLVVLLSLLFFLLHLAPGDPALLLIDPRVPPSRAAELARVFRLDRPLPEQYAAWIGALALRGEWGTSLTHQRPVTAVLAEAVPPTLLLAAAALLVQYAAGIALGVAAARRPGSRRDHLIRVASLGLYSLPVFWLGLMAILLFAWLWPVFPPGQMRSVDAGGLAAAARAADLLHHLALPALVLGLTGAAGVSRYARAGLLDSLAQEYVRTARAKGLSEGRVVWLHALRNALVPLIQLFGVSLSFVLSGALVVEVVFSWPGMGRLAWDAIRSQDYPLVLGATALTGAMVLVGNLLADLLHAAVDPRVRRAG